LFALKILSTKKNRVNDINDIETGKNAGVKTIACDWGYWEDDCKTWNADFIASHPKQIIEWTS